MVVNQRHGIWMLVTAVMIAVPPVRSEDAHAHHHHAAMTGYTRTVQDYRIPDVPLIREDGLETGSAGLFATDRTVVVSFIFTSCSAICPVLTSTLEQARARLGPEGRKLRILSFSIDPEYDTPPRLRAYAHQFKADGDWHFYTGSPASILQLQKAFDAYRGDKSNHAALAFIRPSGQKRWVRLDGFTSAADLARETRGMPGP